MLRHIHIRDFAIVDEVDIEFEPHMTALTGETGAGKSILLDALGLCLGDRADTAAIAAGADRAEIHASFDVGGNDAARDWLAEQAMGAEGECLLRRVVQRNGRSQAWINGRPAPLTLLDELGTLLIDIHGQHAHQSLMRPQAQRAVLDAFADHADTLARIRALHHRQRDLGEEIRRLEGGGDGYEDRLDLLRFQVGEMEALGLNAGEILALDDEQRRLASAGETLEACQAVVGALYEDEQSVQGTLAGAIRRLEQHARLEPALEGPCALLSESLVQLEEGCNGLRHFVDGAELDPERLRWLEERIGLVNDLARKHRVRPQELPERLEALRAELSGLENAGERLESLAAEREAALAEYRAVAADLGRGRAEAGAALAGRVTALLRELGMPDGELSVRVEPDAAARPTAHGLDDVRFEVRTNPDQPPGPLSRVASGGELSRIGLALEVATAGTARIPSLIFDEADAGIGGAVAEVVGRKLRELGERHQVLCVTHLPQVAAQAHHQLRVEKQVTDGRTRTGVAALAGDRRMQEIARMLGGVEITENALNHAREMLGRAG